MRQFGVVDTEQKVFVKLFISPEIEELDKLP